MRGGEAVLVDFNDSANDCRLLGIHHTSCTRGRSVPVGGAPRAGPGRALSQHPRHGPREGAGGACLRGDGRRRFGREARGVAACSEHVAQRGHQGSRLHARRPGNRNGRGPRPPCRGRWRHCPGTRCSFSVLRRGLSRCRWACLGRRRPGRSRSQANWSEPETARGRASGHRGRPGGRECSSPRRGFATFELYGESRMVLLMMTWVYGFQVDIV